MFIDTHCHLNWESYQNDLEEVLARAKESGVEKIITIGVDEESNKATRALLSYNQVYRCVGYHPDIVLRENFDQREINRLMVQLEQEVLVDKTVGIGECGLDYYTIDREGISLDRQETLIDLQKDLFERQVLFAIQNELPLSLHVRDEISDRAYHDILKILKVYFESGNSYSQVSYQFSLNTIAKDSNFEETAFKIPTGGKVNGVLHCVSGSREYVEEAISLGFVVSVAGNVTYKNADKIQDIVKIVPLEMLTIETDGPFLAPVPFRGKRNESSYVVEIAKKIAEIKGVPLETVATETTKTAMNLFDISG